MDEFFENTFFVIYLCRPSCVDTFCRSSYYREVIKYENSSFDQARRKYITLTKATIALRCKFLLSEHT